MSKKLKTLEDERREKMSETLKTLEDIKNRAVDRITEEREYTAFFNDGAIFNVFKEELREEAEKWIFKIETKIKEKEGQFDDFGIDLGMEYAEAGGAIIGFIKHFFNLEEE